MRYVVENGRGKKSFLFNDSMKKCSSELIGLFFAKTGLMAANIIVAIACFHWQSQFVSIFFLVKKDDTFAI